jgi:hypothetical protein
MAIRRRHQDLTSAQGVAVLCSSRWQRPGPGQDLGEQARAIWRDVKDHADGGGKIRRQTRNHTFERFHAAS